MAETPAATFLRLRSVEGLLGRYAYRYGGEVQLHDRLAQVLTEAGIEYERERILDEKNRADFWLDGLVIEVKVDGGMAEALRQIGRYIDLPHVRGVLLASARYWGAQPLREKPKFGGKPFAMTHLRRQAL